MIGLKYGDCLELHRCWSHTVTTVAQNQWRLLDTQVQLGFRMLAALLPNAPVFLKSEPDQGTDTAARQGREESEDLEGQALARTRKGLAPPREIYDIRYRERLDWSAMPDWARPSDPELFEGSGHEG